MKNIVFIIILAALSRVLPAAEQSVILSVPSMTCAVCPITVKKSLQLVKGVKVVNVIYENKIVEVSFDNKLTDIKSLLEATEKAGYPSVLKSEK